MNPQLADHLLKQPAVRALFGRVYPQRGRGRETENERMLGTGYSRFDSNFGMSGMVRIRGEAMDRLDILAVHAQTPGAGAFRRFIAGSKTQFNTIAVWEVWNPWLPEVLLRYGFHPVRERDPITREKVRGYRWCLRNTPSRP